MYALHNTLAAQGTKTTATHTPDDNDLADQLAQYANERTAPAYTVSGKAIIQAAHQAARLAVAGGAWQQVTGVPYNAQPAGYTDPFWGNQGAGWSLVSGRTTALAATPDGTWFAGTADGGVWRSADQGQTWTSVWDNQPSLSIGALAVDPADGSLWVGTGEANSNMDSYMGTGVYRTSDDGNTFSLVGGASNPLASHTVFTIAFDPRGNAYAATNNGLFRYSAATGSWTEVLDPAGVVDNPPYDNEVTSVAVVPGTNGQDVIAAIGWRGPGHTQNNGFYSSTDGGQTFAEVTPAGDINAADIGRTTFAYSADGSKLYALVQSPSMLTAGDESVLQGVFVTTGSPASVTGPWTKIADEATLAASGSALAVGSGFGVGVQAWYNQALTVDPADANHVYLGLEEVFQTNDGGAHWVTASPYWNYPLPCESSGTCPNGTHPDQHAQMITDGKLVIGNDGGVYSRPLSDTQQYGDWTDLNATLRTLQFYDARAGRVGGTQTQVFGGLQDNGSSILSIGGSQMNEAAGGDGFDVIVDPSNGNNVAGEYTDGTLYASTNGGVTFSDVNMSPTCASFGVYGITATANCDQEARFWTPVVQDQNDVKTWILGGRDVWVSRSGWGTVCNVTTCSWTPVYDNGAGHAVTALSSADGGQVIYEAWTTGGGNPGPAFSVGLATNYGGSWHQIDMTGLPQRYIAGVTVDPNDTAHAYVVYNGYSRRWIPDGGIGHVFETWNGGQTWTDISGNLPDVPSDTLVLAGHQLALGTDLGVFTATAGQGTRTDWSRLGTGLPNAAVDDLTPGPGGYLYAATHGRGVWRIQF